MIFWKRKLANLLPWPIQKRIIRNLWIDPYQDIHDKYQAIFIHVPKNAGTSVCYTIFDKEVSHSPLLNYKAHNEEKFENYYKFTFVRNPWDRLVSAFTFLKQGGMIREDKKWAEKHLSRFDSFSEFVTALQSHSFRKKVLRWNHFKPQYTFLINENGEIGVDFVGRYENLYEDFEVVRRKLRTKDQLRHLNETKKRDYREYYDKQLRQIVSDIYKKDIELFNYKFAN